MNTYKILFALRILKNILTSFIDSFLVLYFFTISDNNILPLGIYKLAAVTAIYAAIFLTRNFAKSRYRILLLILSFAHWHFAGFAVFLYYYFPKG